MGKALAITLGVLLLTGCLDRKEEKMERICKDIVLNHVVDLQAVSFNEGGVLSGALNRETFEHAYFGAERGLNKLEEMFVESLFKEGGKGATQHIVNIDYTDKSRGQALATRDQALCSYIEYGDNLLLDSFSVKGFSVSRNKFLEYFIANKMPKDLDHTGKVE